MGPRLFFDTKPAYGFDALLQAFDGRAFASPFRSTVPLVALTKDAWPVFQGILADCGAAGDLGVHFEWRVDSAQGSGRRSQTDAMVLCECFAVAVEAKWTEPRYQTIADRLTRTNRQLQELNTPVDDWRRGQEEFVDGWLELIRPHAAKDLCLADCSDAIYQMVHRAASACAMSRSPMLIYFHFVPEPTGRGASTAQYRADLTSLYRLLGSPNAFPFYLVKVPITPTVAFQGIRDLRKRHPDTDPAVRVALLAFKLFEFGKPMIEKIGRGS